MLKDTMTLKQVFSLGFKMSANLVAISLVLLSGCRINSESPSPQMRTLESQTLAYPSPLEAQKMATMKAAPTPSELEMAVAYATERARVAQATPIPTATPQLGIIESGILVEGLPPRRVAVENVWQGYYEGELALVYAGKLKPDYRAELNPVDTQHGVVYVIMDQPDGSALRDIVSTEQEVGPLHIVSVQNNSTLILTAAISAQTFHFDLDTHQLYAVSTPDKEREQ